MMRRRCPFQRHGMLTEGQLVGLVGITPSALSRAVRGLLKTPDTSGCLLGFSIDLS